MARPIKRTVDYFPHDTHAATSKTMYILDAKYGNDGYAFWFKLLELLGSTAGHVYDCRNAAEWGFLVAKTRVDEDTAERILTTLAELGAIDPELWEHRMIWSQNFVDRLAEVYAKRKQEVPSRPNPAQLPESDGVSGPETPVVPVFSGQTGSETPQSKGKKSTSTSSSVLSGKSVPREHDADDDDDEAPSNTRPLATAVFETLGHLPTAHEIEVLREYDVPYEVLLKALETASVNGARRITYVQRVLDSWIERGVQNVEDVERIESERKVTQISSARASPSSSRAVSEGRVIASAAETDAFLERIGAMGLMKSDCKETADEDRVAT